MNPKGFAIYGLCDPRSKELRYVGKTGTGTQQRLSCHMAPSGRSGQTPRALWLSALHEAGLRPEAFVVEEVDSAADLNEAERHHISTFRAIGCRLLNMTGGGDGLLGLRLPAVTRAKIGAAHRGKIKGPMPKDVREKISKANMGRKRSPEAIAKTAAARRGTRMSKTLVEAMAQQKKEWWGLPGVRAMMSRAKGGRPFVDSAGTRWDTIQEAARCLGLSAGHIHHVLTGKRAHTHGHRFSYIE